MSRFSHTETGLFQQLFVKVLNGLIGITLFLVNRRLLALPESAVRINGNSLVIFLSSTSILLCELFFEYCQYDQQPSFLMDTPSYEKSMALTQQPNFFSYTLRGMRKSHMPLTLQPSFLTGIPSYEKNHTTHPTTQFFLAKSLSKIVIPLPDPSLVTKSLQFSATETSSRTTDHRDIQQDHSYRNTAPTRRP